MRTVLLIDANDYWRDAARVYLRVEGFDVRSTGDGREALDFLADRLEANEPLPAVILLDAAMPDMAGTTFLAQLRAEPRLRGVPVVVCSAQRRDLEGADGFLDKRAGPLELRHTVCEYVVPGEVPGRAGDTAAAQAHGHPAPQAGGPFLTLLPKRL